MTTKLLILEMYEDNIPKEKQEFEYNLGELFFPRIIT